MKNSPSARVLQGFAFDPSFSARLNTFTINQVLYKIVWEEDLQPGPIGEYLEVIDYDPASQVWYKPIDLNDRHLLATNGLSPTEGNPMFHQQMVYAAAMKTIKHFEDALGRKIIWYPRYTLQKRADGKFGYKEDYVPKLRIYPHAIRQSNAFYDPKRKSILFGYFQSSTQHQGANYPGGTVFTCLSPDIVCHEMTHAILDSVHPRYIENSNADVYAFHEAFADLIALFQRFTFKEIVEHQISASRGRLDSYTLLGELATQFGEAMGSHIGALRGAIGKYNPETKMWERHRPDPAKYHTLSKCHDRGALLVAVIFDAYLRLYDFHTRGLMRIANSNAHTPEDGDLHPDLVEKLCFEACKIANRFLNIIIRAIDYCPPVDINFGDYLRALITADIELVPDDENSYRVAFIESFRDWGIYPRSVSTMSVDSLIWEPPSGAAKNLFNVLQEDAIKRGIEHLSTLKDRERIYKTGIGLMAKIHNVLYKRFASQPNIVEECLGLSMRPQLKFRWDNEKITCKVNDFQIHSVQPSFRVGLNFQTLPQVIINIVQKAEFRIHNENIRYRGGCALIFDLSDLSLKYAVVKRLNSEDRLCRQLNYLFGLGDGLGDSTYNIREASAFANIHATY